MRVDCLKIFFSPSSERTITTTGVFVSPSISELDLLRYKVSLFSARLVTLYHHVCMSLEFGHVDPWYALVQLIDHKRGTDDVNT